MTWYTASAYKLVSKITGLRESGSHCAGPSRSDVAVPGGLVTSTRCIARCLSSCNACKNIHVIVAKSGAVFVWPLNVADAPVIGCIENLLDMWISFPNDVPHLKDCLGGQDCPELYPGVSLLAVLAQAKWLVTWLLEKGGKHNVTFKPGKSIGELF